jgi:redox-sensitive bicupin YhaK (pirin superfamily)
MIRIRQSADRGRTKIDWLDSKHSFSFGEYYDPLHMGFSVLRVINEDKVISGAGFDTHSHQNMEIISYVLEGALEHKDSLGTGSIILPGDVQRMSAGRGIRHSEFNPKNDQPLHFLQIWILAEKEGISPSYEQKNFNSKRKSGSLTLVASNKGREGSLTLHQDVDLYVLDLDAHQSVEYVINKNRSVWLQVARGSLKVNDHLLSQGDGASITHDNLIDIQGLEKAEILLFDLPL